jgi:hypothetical protein
VNLKLSSPPPAYSNPWEIRVNFKFKFSSPSIYQDPLEKKNPNFHYQGDIEPLPFPPPPSKHEHGYYHIKERKNHGRKISSSTIHDHK